MTHVPISKNRVVHFRVRSIGPNPVSLLGAVDAFLLRIEYVSESGAQGFSMPDDWLVPYREALQEAERTQTVFWVNLDDHLDLAVPERFMLAIRDGQIVQETSERQVPNPHIPVGSMIAEGKTVTGETVRVAVGVCVCNEERDESKGSFRLKAGDSWVCRECGRLYAFDGERIHVQEA